MRTTYFSLFLVLLVQVFQGCKKNGLIGIRGDGPSVTAARNLPAFEAISLNNKAEVTYIPDSVYRVVLEAQQNILNVLTTEVSGTELLINFSKPVWKSEPVKITVYSPSLRKIKICGSGNVATAYCLPNDLVLDISGSGNIRVPEVKGEYLTVKLSGSGNILVASGQASNASLELKGSGTIDTELVKTNHAQADISGSGNISLSANNTLKASISGSGNIRYRGQPILNARVTGSGKIICLN